MATNEYYEPTTEEFKAEVRAQFAALETRLQEAEVERERLATRARVCPRCRRMLTRTPDDTSGGWRCNNGAHGGKAIWDDYELDIIFHPLEMDRLAAELLASQAREAELRSALLATERVTMYGPADQVREKVRSALASPSPAAAAIGRVLQVVARVAEVADEPEAVYQPKRNMQLARLRNLTDLLAEEWRALQALRSGQPSPGEEGS